MREATARKLLEAERRRIESVREIERRRWTAATEGGPFDELSSVDQHPADGASELLEHEIDASVLAMEERRLADVSHALARLAAGTYGTCELCTARIPESRLRAEPATRLCIDCERRWELRHLDRSTPVIRRVRGDTAPPPTSLRDLPDDEDLDEAVELSAEESAMHLDRGWEVLSVDEVERIKAFELAQRARDEDDRPVEGRTP